jgi:hypothetical protein
MSNCPRLFDYPRLIKNAEKAYNNANTVWARKYWLEVLTKLSQNVQNH